jgi:hypothetical protein
MVLTMGICLLLQPTPADVALAAAFGVLVAVLKRVGARCPSRAGWTPTCARWSRRW